jgi:hypothetical protein
VVDGAHDKTNAVQPERQHIMSHEQLLDNAFFANPRKEALSSQQQQQQQPPSVRPPQNARTTDKDLFQDAFGMSPVRIAEGTEIASNNGPNNRNHPRPPLPPPQNARTTDEDLYQDAFGMSPTEESYIPVPAPVQASFHAPRREQDSRGVPYEQAPISTLLHQTSHSEMLWRVVQPPPPRSNDDDLFEAAFTGTMSSNSNVVVDLCVDDSDEDEYEYERLPPTCSTVVHQGLRTQSKSPRFNIAARAFLTSPQPPPQQQHHQQQHQHQQPLDADDDSIIECYSEDENQPRQLFNGRRVTDNHETHIRNHQQQQQVSFIYLFIL